MKTCKIHGVLTPDDLIKSGKTKKGTQQFKCKKCMKKFRDEHYANNSKLILEKHALYRKNNPKKVAETKHLSWIKHKDKYRLKMAAYRRQWDKCNREKSNTRKIKNRIKARKELRNSYIKALLANHSTLKSSEIPESLCDVKRAIIKINKTLRGDKFNAT